MRRGTREAKRDRNRHRKGVTRPGLALGRDPSELAQGLIESSPFEAATQEQLRSFLQVLLCLAFGAALGRDVKRRATSNVPVIAALNCSENLEPDLETVGHWKEGLG